MKDLEEFCPKDSNHWREWLEENHQQKEAVWVIFYKTKSPKHNLSWSHAVDEALCFGWIDSVKKPIDAERFKQYFGKRKPKSNWSRINKQKVTTLIDQGLMEYAGHKCIEVAKENGSWTILDNLEDLIVPPDLKEALSKLPDAWAYFNALSNSNKKILLYWVVSAKREETRKKRIEDIAANASQGQKPKPFR